MMVLFLPSSSEFSSFGLAESSVGKARSSNTGVILIVGVNHPCPKETEELLEEIIQT
jgi:hypothetical protein